jgi:hypothetical protein
VEHGLGLVVRVLADGVRLGRKGRLR